MKLCEETSIPYSCRILASSLGRGKRMPTQRFRRLRHNHRHQHENTNQMSDETVVALTIATVAVTAHTTKQIRSRVSSDSPSCSFAVIRSTLMTRSTSSTVSTSMSNTEVGALCPELSLKPQGLKHPALSGRPTWTYTVFLQTLDFSSSGVRGGWCIVRSCE